MKRLLVEERIWRLLLTPIFEKTGQKGGKEKQPMRNRVQSADGRKGRMVNRIRRWSRKLKSVKWASESKRSAESQLEDQPMERKKLVTRKVRPKESMIETGQSTIGNGSRVGF
jgi:hypothetical protein